MGEAMIANSLLLKIGRMVRRLLRPCTGTSRRMALSSSSRSSSPKRRGMRWTPVSSPEDA